MRINRFRLLVLGVGVVCLLGPTIALTQDRGGFGGDPNSRMKFKGGGGDPSSSRGGRGGFDPSRIFDFMAQGQPTLSVEQFITSSERRDPTARARIEQFVKDSGISNGQITREQFSSFMEKRMAERAAGGDTPRGPGSSADSGQSDEDRFKEWFTRYDLDKDGFLSYEEASGGLKAEFDRYDTNHDKKISMDEAREYFMSRTKQMRGDPSAGGRGGNWLDSIQDAVEEEEKRPTVYRFDNLPRELLAVAPWFQQLDRDKDGQVALYEWKDGGRTVDEFMKWDANGDGLITVEEALRFIQANKGQLTTGGAGADGADPNANGQGGAGFNMMSNGFNRRGGGGGSPMMGRGNFDPRSMGGAPMMGRGNFDPRSMGGAPSMGRGNNSDPRSMGGPPSMGRGNNSDPRSAGGSTRDRGNRGGGSQDASSNGGDTRGNRKQRGPGG